MERGKARQGAICLFLTSLCPVAGEKVRVGLLSHPPGDACAHDSRIVMLAKLHGHFDKNILFVCCSSRKLEVYAQEEAIGNVDDRVGRGK